MAFYFLPVIKKALSEKIRIAKTPRESFRAVRRLNPKEDIKMKFVVGFLTGGAIAAGALVLADSVDMRKMKKKCRGAKRMIKGMI